MKILFCLLLWGTISSGVYAQRVLPAKSKEQKRTEKQIEKKENSLRQKDTELRWDPRRLPSKSKGFPEISAWHTGTAGIVASDAAEISLFNPTRIGFSKRTEILFRIAEEPFLPNIGLKHRWWGNRRFAWATAHTLYYSYPGLKILQSTGFKELVPDSVQVAQGMAMRHEILFSWLLNPQVWGCPDPSAEKILTLHAGIEGYVGFGNNEVMPFDYAQLVFCDISTPQAAPKAKQAVSAVNPLEAAALPAEGKAPFTVYDDIRSKLIARGVPAGQIAFIHDANTEVKKKELFGKVRSGQVRVLLGSTSKMGAGTNVQDKLVAIHDLDCRATRS